MRTWRAPGRLSTARDGLRPPKVEVRDHHVLRGNFAVSVALILVGLGYLATDVHHPLRAVVVVPVVFGLVRLAHTLWVLRNQRGDRRG